MSGALTPAGGSPVAATVAYDGPTSTATLTPSGPLAYSTTYTATVTTVTLGTGGTQVTRYAKIGRTVHCSGRITLGTGRAIRDLSTGTPRGGKDMPMRKSVCWIPQLLGASMA